MSTSGSDDFENLNKQWIVTHKVSRPGKWDQVT
jgi:hypothetical protein